MTVTEALEFRRAVPAFDPAVPISRPEIERLIDLANLAPSSMNLQPWSFLLAHGVEDRRRLQAACMNQGKVSQASAVLVVVGNLHHHEHAAAVTQGAVARGYYDAEKAAATIKMAHDWFGQNPAIQRDEIFRGCSLWSMAFMMVCAESGWDTAPMGGFDASAIQKEFGLPDHQLPVLVIAIGRRDPTVKLAERNVRFSAASLIHEGAW